MENQENTIDIPVLKDNKRKSLKLPTTRNEIGLIDTEADTQNQENTETNKKAIPKSFIPKLGEKKPSIKSPELSSNEQPAEETPKPKSSDDEQQTPVVPTKDEKSNDNSELLKKIEDLNQSVKLKEEEIAKLNKDITKKNSQIKLLTKKIEQNDEEYIQQINGKQKEIDELKENNIELAQEAMRADELEDSQKELTEELKAANKTIESYEKKIESLEEGLKSAVEKAKKQKVENESLFKSLQDSQKAFEEKAVKEIKNEMNNQQILQTQIHTLKENNKDLEIKLDKMNNDCANAKIEKEELKEEIRKLKEIVNDNRREREEIEIKERFEDEKNKRDLLEKEIQLLKAKLEEKVEVKKSVEQGIEGRYLARIEQMAKQHRVEIEVIKETRMAKEMEIKEAKDKILQKDAEGFRVKIICIVSFIAMIVMIVQNLLKEN